MSLTPRQLDVLNAMKAYRTEHNVNPTLREIAEALHISKTAVMEHVSLLIEKGYLRRGDPKKSRSIEPINDDLIARMDAVEVVKKRVDRLKPEDKVGDLGPRLKKAIEKIPSRSHP